MASRISAAWKWSRARCAQAQRQHHVALRAGEVARAKERKRECVVDEHVVGARGVRLLSDLECLRDVRRGAGMLGLQVGRSPSPRR